MVSPQRQPSRRPCIVVFLADHKDAEALLRAAIMAVRIRTRDRVILVISVYIPPVATTIELIRGAVRQGQELIIAGGFNRNEVGASAGQGEATPVIEVMVDMDLQSLLPRGTKTFESSQVETTIDLVVTTPALAPDRVVCQVYCTEHGLDHLAISTTFAIDLETTTPQSRRLFKDADWKCIRTAVAGKAGRPPQKITDYEISQHAARLTDTFEAAINDHIPVAKPSAYAKR